MEKVLLCSSPRSGSTFAANLIRSSPDVTFLNEIMTRGKFLLPEFIAARNATSDGETLRLAFESGLDRLMPYTLPQAGNLVHRSRLVKTMVFGALKTASSLTARIGLQGFDRNLFYWYYYINGLHEPFVRPFYEIQFPKNRVCTSLLFKEVHLLRSYRSFRAMYPEGKVIFLIRDPYRQVASERKHHGYTGQAPRTPEEEDEHEQHSQVGLDQVLSLYGENELIRTHYGRSFEQTFSLFWRLENDAVVEMMEQENSERFLVLRYEDLVDDTRASIERMLDFMGLDLSANLERYLHMLTEYRGSQKHGRSTFVSRSSLAQKSNADLKDERVSRVAEVVSGSLAAQKFEYE